MLDKRSLHAKVQEQADCFVTSDLLAEMAGLGKERDSRRRTLKWIALAVLHGIERNAKRISLRRTSDGGICADGKVPGIRRFPKPSSSVGRKVFDVVKGITHIDENEGK